MTASQRWPAVGLMVLGAVTGLLGLAVPDERIRILLWILAVPMVISGLVAIAWGNARRELERLRDAGGR
jgi:uncharacterized membrane protein HdeD (DUF308 family)